MQKSCYLIALIVWCLAIQSNAAGLSRDPADSVSIEGRWDITIDMGGKPAPSWLEVRHSGFRTLVGSWVGVVGSARPISLVRYTGGKIHFAIPPQWEEGEKDLVVEGQVQNNSLTGTITFPDGKQFRWTGVKAPSLSGEKAPVWGAPVQLFNGRNLNGWHAIGGDNQWIAQNGMLVSPKSGANLATDQTFSDFKLHIEFRYPKGSNSGVYLRGRYELQITDSKGADATLGDFGAIYGFISPSEQAALEPGAWQSYDITLIGRKLTVVANGKTIICDREIPGITGGALDSNEGEPGPLYLQGDHGPVEYRNIVLTPAK